MEIYQTSFDGSGAEERLSAMAGAGECFTSTVP